LSSPATTPITLPGSFTAVVFDMDGLLVHTERQWLQAKNILFERYGQVLTEADRAAVFGAAELQSATYFAGRFGLPPERIVGLRDEYIGIIGDLIEQGVELTDGAVDLIDRLAGDVPLGLASNARRALVDKVLAQTPFGPRFETISTADETRPKPAPDLYLLACERLGADLATALAIEDSPTGVKAAQSAGMTCIGVPSNPSEPLPEADFVVSSLTELV